MEELGDWCKVVFAAVLLEAAGKCVRKREKGCTATRPPPPYHESVVSEQIMQRRLLNGLLVPPCTKMDNRLPRYSSICFTSLFGPLDQAIRLIPLVQRSNSWTKTRQKSSEFSFLLTHCHLYSFALRFLFLQIYATSYSFWPMRERRGGGVWDLSANEYICAQYTWSLNKLGDLTPYLAYAAVPLGLQSTFIEVLKPLCDSRHS
jgi:hypothetical protein